MVYIPCFLNRLFRVFSIVSNSVAEKTHKKKEKKKKMLYIPVDIVRIILGRVPAESLIRFKLVCKQWQSMINNDPLFPKLDMLVIITSKSNQCTSHVIPLCSLSSSKTTVHAKKISTSDEYYYCKLFKRSLSCHGFLLQYLHHKSWVMLNPFSGEQLTLTLDISGGYMGLGYDIKTNDFKVVRIYFDYNLNRTTSIYSVKSRAWHHIEDTPRLLLAGDGVFANGLFYFLASEGVEIFDVVISLDLSTETYSKLALPNCFDESRYSHRMLHSLDGRLFLSNNHGRSSWDLWILQENGKWDKLIAASSGRCQSFKDMTPIAYLKSEEQIVVSYGDRFAWFDLKNSKCIKEVTMHSAAFTSMDTFHLLPVSLNWFSGNRNDENDNDLKFEMRVIDDEMMRS